ncbi:MAG: V-type ATP synthase subunit A [Thaumarchaeota archaeon]|nr:V-type ATP synthase subunit A [Nitrososphaerota archaeon]MCZ6615954.1 V-type ATP synthase subunit A [Nitrososphaerota archaeon]MCZ6724997.1 V-type ATP synthase subunit A [Nitrososphaerota archaeon]
MVVEGKGKISRISGPVIRSEGMSGAQMYENVQVGEERILGEVIRVEGNDAIIQVYESTSGLKPGDPVFRTGQPLSVTLGPGIAGALYDGVQRPLDKIAAISGAFIKRGIQVPPIPIDKKWPFIPSVKKGDKISPGSIVGSVQETPLIDNKIMVHPDARAGKIDWIIKKGEYEIEEPIAKVVHDDGTYEVKMYQRWPVRRPRPYSKRLEATTPLLTGQRVLDTLFPMAKGGVGAIPGAFGTGKTVTLHQIAAWANVKVVVYVGCGERGNEMTEVLIKFPELIDPSSGRPLMERTILVANTSNMPVAAREASIYTGVTIAEYYRDMGYDVVLVADSTSRWAEALREISGRLEEMPAEEGYPSYLASRIAEFYERAGQVTALGSPERTGSISLIGAVSPSGGDFTEPVTTHTMRFIRTFWALDASLAYSRHYPAINWISSYSGYTEEVEKWWRQEVNKDWADIRQRAYRILQDEDELKEIVRLLGPEALPDSQKLTLDLARMLREGFLQQSAFDKVDAYTGPHKQFNLLKVFIDFYDLAQEGLKAGVSLVDIRSIKLIPRIMRAKYDIKEEEQDKLAKLGRNVSDEFKKLSGEVVN